MAITNNHMPGLVKIGYTERLPTMRAEELSSASGVPGSFVVQTAEFVAIQCGQNVISIKGSGNHA